MKKLRIRLRLVDNWFRVFWRSWSNRLTGLLVLVQTVSQFPEIALTIYRLIPDDIQFLLPGRTITIIALGALALLARVVKQKKLKGDDNDEGRHEQNTGRDLSEGSEPADKPDAG